MTVDGVKMDPAVALDLEETTTTTALQQATELEQSTVLPGNTGGGSLSIDPTGTYSESEVNAAQYLADQGHEVQLRPPAGTRSGGGTSDLAVDGENRDVYTPTSKNPNRIISKIASKGSQVLGGGVIVDLSQTSVTPEDFGNVLYRVQNTGARVGSIVIMPNG